MSKMHGKKCTVRMLSGMCVCQVPKSDLVAHYQHAMQGVVVYLPREEVLTKENQSYTGDQSGAAHLFWPVVCLALSCSAPYISAYIKGNERNRYGGGKQCHLLE